MKRRIFATGLACLTCTAGLLPSTLANATPAAPCTPATMTPIVTSVPANFPGFGYDALKAASTDVQLFDAADKTTQIPVTLGPVQNGLLKVAPTTALTVGHSYELDYSSFCSYGPTPQGSPLTFNVTAEEPLPTKLGVLAGTPTFTVTDYGTSEYLIVANLTLDPEMIPWVSIYQLQVSFDGNVIETQATTSGAGTMQINATGWCDATTAATPTHQMIVQAALPSTSTIAAAPVALTFDCPAPVFDTPPPSDPTPGGATSTTSTTNASSGKSHSGCSIGASPSESIPTFALGIGLVIGVGLRFKKSAKSPAKRGQS